MNLSNFVKWRRIKAQLSLQKSTRKTQETLTMRSLLLEITHQWQLISRSLKRYQQLNFQSNHLWHLLKWMLHHRHMLCSWSRWKTMQNSKQVWQISAISWCTRAKSGKKWVMMRRLRFISSMIDWRLSMIFTSKSCENTANSRRVKIMVESSTMTRTKSYSRNVSDNKEMC